MKDFSISRREAFVFGKERLMDLEDRPSVRAVAVSEVQAVMMVVGAAVRMRMMFMVATRRRAAARFTHFKTPPVKSA
jgi:hypothetical protein